MSYRSFTRRFLTAATACHTGRGAGESRGTGKSYLAKAMERDELVGQEIADVISSASAAAAGAAAAARRGVGRGCGGESESC